ncbi:A/G-specific adenine glycosylase [Pseudanabaena sp. lw0831]|nr:A/G-specific adenine glycosylase [Pseudanabaena sp. lw0831]
MDRYPLQSAIAPKPNLKSAMLLANSPRTSCDRLFMQANLESEKVKWFREQLKAWAAIYLRDFPWRQTSEPYAIFVAKILLQKTAAEMVAPIYEAF